jgi:hypothetical protein
MNGAPTSGPPADQPAPPPNPTADPGFMSWLQQHYDNGALDQVSMNLASKLGIGNATTVTPTSPPIDRLSMGLGTQPPPGPTPGMVSPVPQAGHAGFGNVPGNAGTPAPGFQPPRGTDMASIDAWVNALPDTPPPDVQKATLPSSAPPSQGLPRPFGEAVGDAMLLNPLDPKDAGVAGGSAGGGLSLGTLLPRTISTYRDALHGDPSAIGRGLLAPLLAAPATLIGGAEYGAGTRAAGDTTKMLLALRTLAPFIPGVNRVLGAPQVSPPFSPPIMRMLGR